MKYKKRPVTVEAHQWHRNGDHPEDNSQMITPAKGDPFLSEGKVVRRFRHPGVPGSGVCKECGWIMNNHGWIDTLEGGHTVCPGDFIITGVKGERYPCKPDIFRMTYDPVLGGEPVPQVSQ